MIFHDHRTEGLSRPKFLGERYTPRGHRLRTGSSGRGALEPFWHLFRALAAPAVGAVDNSSSRIFRYAAEAGRLARFISHLPVVAIGLTARAAGEGSAHWSIACRRS